MATITRNHKHDLHMNIPNESLCKSTLNVFSFYFSQTYFESSLTDLPNSGIYYLNSSFSSFDKIKFFDLGTSWLLYCFYVQFCKI